MSEEFFKYMEQLFDPSQAPLKPKPLEGIRVIDVTMIILGPMSPSILGSLGAEVIKVEGPRGDWAWRPIIPAYKDNLNSGFAQDNLNKYHISLDIRHPKGKEVFKRLVAKSDVLVENLTPENMDLWGVGYKDLVQINPRLIYFWHGGWGRWGRYAGIPSYDALGQAHSGLAGITGFPGCPPLRALDWIGDYFGALAGAFGVLVGLFYRELTGRGCYGEIGHPENLTRFMDWTWLYISLTGEDRPRTGNVDIACGPAAILPCKDAMVAIAAVLDDEFKGLCEAMGKPQLANDPRFKDIPSRLKKENLEEIIRMMSEWVKDKTANELEQIAEKYGFACAKVMNVKDQYESEHLRVRRQWLIVNDPIFGEVHIRGMPLHMSETPWHIRWVGRPYGIDTEFVLRHIVGLSTEEIEELRKEGVCKDWRDMPEQLQKLGYAPPPYWKEEGKWLRT